MSAFNTVVIRDDDVAPGEDVRVQFKYGLARQLTYRVGDTLRWPQRRPPTRQEADTDVPGLARVGKRAPHRYVDYVVRIRGGVIAGVERVPA